MLNNLHLQFGSFCILSRSERKLHTYMSIEMSSSARSVTGNPWRSLNGNELNGVKERLNKVFEGMEPPENWREIFLVAGVIALIIDALFLFIPEIDYQRFCIDFDERLRTIACLLRILYDLICLYIIFRFQKSLRGKVSGKKRLFYLIVDIVSILPIPVILVIPLRAELSKYLVSRRILKWTIVGQYIPRIIRIYPIYKAVTKTTVMPKLLGALLNLSLFLLCSYVFGAFWYVTAIEMQSQCWSEAWPKDNLIPGRDLRNLYCSHTQDNSLFLKKSCPLIDPSNITKPSIVLARSKNSYTNSPAEFDFGMYIDVLKSEVGSNRLSDFPKKFFYCFWWGLRNLSTYAQGLIPGNSATDSLFAILICASGLFLFAVLIGNVQKFMESSTASRVEEIEKRKKDTEQWMSSRNLPNELQERIKKYKKNRWHILKGTDEESFLRSLPENLRLETQRYLDQASV